MMKIETWFKVVRCLPEKLNYVCAMNVLAYATQGKYGGTEVPGLPAMDAIKRYADDKGI